MVTLGPLEFRWLASSLAFSSVRGSLRAGRPGFRTGSESPGVTSRTRRGLPEGTAARRSSQLKAADSNSCRRAARTLGRASLVSSFQVSFRAPVSGPSPVSGQGRRDSWRVRDEKQAKPASGKRSTVRCWDRRGGWGAGWLGLAIRCPLADGRSIVPDPAGSSVKSLAALNGALTLGRSEQPT